MALKLCIVCYFSYIHGVAQQVNNFTNFTSGYSFENQLAFACCATTQLNAHFVFTMNIKNEQWKTIKDFPDYQVSNIGRIKSFVRKNPRILKTHDNGRGYLVIYLRNSRERRGMSVHRLVAIHFLENKGNKPQVNHIDGNKTNNRFDNLEWSTAEENTRHAIDNKLMGTKLSRYQIPEIRRKWKSGLFSQKQLSRRYGVTSAQISHIVNKKRWVDVA